MSRIPSEHPVVTTWDGTGRHFGKTPRLLLAIAAMLTVGLLPFQASLAATEKAKAKQSPHPHDSGRVAALRKELAICEQKGNYFTREACKEKVRWKYCGAPFSRDPLWGKVPECPNSQPQNATP